LGGKEIGFLHDWLDSSPFVERIHIWDTIEKYFKRTDFAKRFPDFAIFYVHGLE